MTTTEVESAEETPSEIAKWDPGLTERVIGWLRPLIKGYHRAEVRGLESFPPGGALVVSNHSGGLFPLDVPVFATGFYGAFGYDRPVYTLSHDMLFNGPQGDLLIRTGFIRANHENAEEALLSGASWWCSRAAITTCTDRRCRRTESISTAEPATCGRP